MRKSILISLILSISTYLCGQTYQLQYKGSISSPSIKGYVRDASFYNDTCYFITGDGSTVLMADINGRLLSNHFSGLSLDEARMIYVNANHIVILEQAKISFYTKQGQYVKQIALPDTKSFYFFVRNDEEIMVASYNRILVYNYATGSLMAQKNLTRDFTRRFINDGKRILCPREKLMAYERQGTQIVETDITTTKYAEYADINSGHYFYLSCHTGTKSLWFDYLKRDTLFVMDSSFTTMIGTYPLLPISQKPSEEELYIESGNPNLKIICAQRKIYVIETPLNGIKFYRLMGL